jgi:hypothetical protein
MHTKFMDFKLPTTITNDAICLYQIRLFLEIDVRGNLVKEIDVQFPRENDSSSSIICLSHLHLLFCLLIHSQQAKDKTAK